MSRPPTGREELLRLLDEARAQCANLRSEVERHASAHARELPGRGELERERDALRGELLGLKTLLARSRESDAALIDEQGKQLQELRGQVNALRRVEARDALKMKVESLEQTVRQLRKDAEDRKAQLAEARETLAQERQQKEMRHSAWLEVTTERDALRGEVLGLRETLARIGLRLEVLVGSDADEPIEAIGQPLRQGLHEAVHLVRTALAKDPTP